MTELEHGPRAIVRARGALLTAAALAACQAEHPQSVVHPRGPAAAAIGGLWWFLAVLVLAVFVVTMTLLVMALRRPRDTSARTDTDGGPPLGTTRFVVVSGIVVPGILLVGLLFASLGATVALRQPTSSFTTVRIVGHQWWWHVEYPEFGIVTANELHVPVGEIVRLELTSADVVHSLWIPSLAGKIDLLPERRNEFWLQADVAGVYRGQCAEFCGVQHANMALEVVALPRAAFDDWARRMAEEQRAPPGEPSARRGHDVFFAAGCDACHAIAGTAARGRLGPDLTHLASRRMLAAATVPNEPSVLRRWLRAPQRIKPGNRMPATDLPDAELDALVAFLTSLE